MHTARARLAALVAAAGYPDRLLIDVAHATLPAYRPGAPLSDAQVGQVASAVEALAQAGHDAARADALIARHRHDGGPHWRETLWAEASGPPARATPIPERHGLSPCETTHGDWHGTRPRQRRA